MSSKYKDWVLIIQFLLLSVAAKILNIFLSGQNTSYGHHCCVTHLYGIPLLIFNCAIDIGFVGIRQRRLPTR